MGAHIPVLMVEDNCLAGAWEHSLVALHGHGCDIKTEHDRPEDPPSKDCSMTIVVQDPASVPALRDKAARLGRT